MAAGVPIANEPISTLMHGDVVSVDPRTSLRELAQTMISEEVGSVVVTEAGQIVGIVTKRDLVQVIADGDPFEHLAAEDVMSPAPLCADVEDSVGLIAARVAEAGLMHVPVVRAGRLVGMVSARDFLTAFSEIAAPRGLPAL